MAKTIKLANKTRPSRAQRPPKNSASSSHTRDISARTTNSRKKIATALLQEMTRRLVNEFQPEQVILFGSYAWGTPNEDSDVDLMVIVSASDEKEHKRMVRALHALRDKPVPTDVFVKTRAEFDRYKHVYASLECLITEKGQVLYDRRREEGTGPELVSQSTT